jgi:hypothetical protein
MDKRMLEAQLDERKGFIILDANYSMRGSIWELFGTLQGIIIMVIIVGILFVIALAVHTGVLPLFEKAEKLWSLGEIKLSGNLTAKICTNKNEIQLNNVRIYHYFESKAVEVVPVMAWNNTMAVAGAIMLPTTTNLSFVLNTAGAGANETVILSFWRNDTCTATKLSIKEYDEFLQKTIPACKSFYSSAVLPAVKGVC